MPSEFTATKILGPDGNPLMRESPVLPHVYTFASLLNSATRSYSWRWDEAYRQSQENALAMRRDCFLMGLLRERQMPTAMMEWHLEPEDQGDAKQLEICEHLTKAIKRIPRLRGYLMSALDALWYGRAAVQQVWGLRTIAGKPTYTVTKHAPINGDKVQYNWDDVPRILITTAHRDEIERNGGNIVITDRFTAVELDSPYWRDRFLIHRHDVVDADFFDATMAGSIQGVGIRHWVYWLDWLKKEISSWVIDFMERVGLGFTVFYYEEGNPQARAAADAAARDYGRNTRIVWPRSTGGSNVGNGIERIETPTSGADFIVRLMEYFDDKIERFIVGQSMSGGKDAENSLGGSGRAKLAKDTKYRNIAWDCDNLGESLQTDLLAPMMRFNYPQEEWTPRWCFDIESPDPKEKLEAATLLHNMGIPLKIAEVRAWAGASEPTDDDEVTESAAMMQATIDPEKHPRGPAGTFATKATKTADKDKSSSAA